MVTRGHLEVTTGSPRGHWTLEGHHGGEQGVTQAYLYTFEEPQDILHVLTFNKCLLVTVL